MHSVMRSDTAHVEQGYIVWHRRFDRIRSWRKCANPPREFRQHLPHLLCWHEEERARLVKDFQIEMVEPRHDPEPRGANLGELLGELPVDVPIKVPNRNIILLRPEKYSGLDKGIRSRFDRRG